MTHYPFLFCCSLRHMYFDFLVVDIYESTAPKTHLNIFYTMVKTMDDSFITIGKYETCNDKLFFFHLEQHIIFGIFCSRKFRTLFFHASFLACINSLIFFYIFYKNSLAFCFLIFWGTLFICITFYLSWMKKQRKTFLKFLH